MLGLLRKYRAPSRPTTSTTNRKAKSRHRRAFFEPLEDRRVLASVVVFDDPTYVDTTNNYQAESDTVQAALVASGHSVTTFTGITAADINAAVAGKDVLLFPELELRNLGPTLDSAARAAITSFVSSGGGLIIHGDFFGHDEAFLNNVFGFSLTQSPTTFSSYDLTAQAAGTAFEGGPASLPHLSGTSLHPISALPADARVIYSAPSNAAVWYLTYGAGSVVFLAYDWWDAAPLGMQESDWNQVLDRAVTQASNTAPIANANGSYAVPEGLAVTLTGLGSTDSDGSIVAYEWDLNNDGVFETSGQTAVFSAATLDDSVYTVHLRVTDNLGATNIATTTVTVLNVAPAAASHSINTNEGAVANLNVLDGAFDLGMQDVLSAVAANGTTPAGALYTIAANGQATYDPNGKFEYLGPGQTAIDSFSYTIVDDDGGSDTATVTVTITGLNDAPALDLNGPDDAGINFVASFLEGGGPVAVVDSDLTLVDPENIVESATILLTHAYDGLSESLAIDAALATSLGIAVSYSSDGAVLQLTGAASVASYQSLLRTVTYNNVSTNPNTTPRLIDFVVRDGIDDSPTASATVQITPVSEISLAVSPSSVSEDGGGNLVFTFTRTAPFDEQTIPFVIGGSATFGGSNADYTVSGAASFDGAAGTVTFADGSATATVVVTPLADNVVELDETVTLTLTAGAGYNVETVTPVTGTIANDDSATISIANASGLESGGPIFFTITLSGPVDVSVAFNIGTQVVSAPPAGTSAASTTDFSPLSGAIGVFARASGAQSILIAVPIVNDGIVELDEVFEVVLSGLSAGGRDVTLSNPVATGTILNDDTATLTLTPASALEDSGSLTFQVTLSDAVDVPVTVDVSTFDVALEAVAGSDYVASATTLTFQGAAGEVKSFTVTLLADNVYEDDEDFAAQLGAVDAQGRAVTANTTPVLGTILNDDSYPQVTLSAAPLAIDESSVSTITIQLSNPSENPVIVNLALSGTATVVADYSISSTQLTIDPLATSQTATITTILDAIQEAKETIIVEIDSVAGGEEVGEQSITIQVFESYDFGDAPDSYGTTNGLGARHLRSSIGVHLGATVDWDSNGQPGPLANGDDSIGLDDEDGVTLPSQLIAQQGAKIIVNASGAGKLDAWIDFNRNGVFEASERIANALPVAAGDNTLVIDVPENLVTGVSYARFRISSVGGLAPSGYAPDGEVEDYAIELLKPAPGSAGIVSDPLFPGQSMLLIQGTAGTDAIVIQPYALIPGYVQVVYPTIGSPIFPLSAFSRIVAYGGAGHDVITVDAAITKPAYLYGGDGNDTLSGGSGDDYLYGGAGVDTLLGNAGNDVILGELDADNLYGGLGRDVLIGGGGSDWLYGNDDDDLLIGNNAPTSLAALEAIKSAWSLPITFAQRVAALSGTLNSSTVLDDGVADYIYGHGGSDWLLDFQNRDQFLDFASLSDRKN